VFLLVLFHVCSTSCSTFFEEWSPVPRLFSGSIREKMLVLRSHKDASRVNQATALFWVTGSVFQRFAEATERLSVAIFMRSRVCLGLRLCIDLLFLVHRFRLFYLALSEWTVGRSWESLRIGPQRNS
jgi:hypothetical protein